jgi:hypothetical protein
MSDVFKTLAALNVNDHTEKKSNGYVSLTYLSWTWAIQAVKEKYPDMTYEVVRFENGLPYVYDEKTGYMVFNRVTIEGQTHEMWLPVMDGANKAMKSEPYTYKTRNGEKTVDAATMFDVNTAIMRCLVKNLAMFGLGLYIYAGEDLPEAEKPSEADRPKLIADIYNFMGRNGLDEEKVYKKTKISSIEELPLERLAGMLTWLNGLDDKKREELM